MSKYLDKTYWENYEVLSYETLEEYFNFISDRLKCEIPDRSVSEVHHIIPVSFDRSLKRDNDNKIRLRYEDHYKAHEILSRCFYGDHAQKMCYAFMKIAENPNSEYQITAEQYSEAKGRYSSLMSERMKGNTVRKGMKESDETKRKKSEASKGRRHSEESKRKIGESNKGKRKGIKMSDEARAKISAATSGKNNPNYGKSVLKGYTWMKSPDGTHTSVSPSNYDKYIELGYVKEAPFDHNGDKNPTYGKIGINDGKHCKFVEEKELQYYLDNGWSLGRIKRKSVNNGIENKYVLISEIDYYLSIGWKKGRI